MKKRLLLFVAFPFMYLSVSRGVVAQSFPISQLTKQSTHTKDLSRNSQVAPEDAAIMAVIPGGARPAPALLSSPQSQKACSWSQTTAMSDKTYNFNGEFFFPIWHKGCDVAAQNAFFTSSGVLSAGNQAKYLYNPAQSTNQISADLMTLTFWGIQLIAAGTASGSTAQPSSSTGSGTPTPTQSVSTAVSKLQQGGDFNLRAPIVIGRRSKVMYTVDIRSVPNLGFSINNNTMGTTTTTPTVVEATNKAGNIPLEVTFLTPTVSTSPISAVFYASAQYSAEILGADLAKTIGTAKTFGLGQFSVGLNVSDKFNIGFQYFIGPKQVYCTVTSTGCTATTGSVSGMHLVLSFTK